MGIEALNRRDLIIEVPGCSGHSLSEGSWAGLGRPTGFRRAEAPSGEVALRAATRVIALISLANHGSGVALAKVCSQEVLPDLPDLQPRRALKVASCFKDYWSY